MRLRAAVVGCGRIASGVADDPAAEGVQSHAGAYVASPLTDLVALCDTDPDRLEACGARWGVRRLHASLEDLMAGEGLDLVSVCTPDDTHHAILRTLVDGGVGIQGVLAEKPLAMTAVEARDVVARAHAAGVVLAVNHTRRYAPGFDAAEEAIRSGRIGTVQAVSGYYTRGTRHNGTHWFDLARRLVGEVRRVRGWDVLGEGGTDPTLDADLEFASGAGGHLQALRSAEFDLFEMDVVGSAGRMRFGDSGHRMEVSRVGPNPRYSGYRTLVGRRTRAVSFRDAMLRAVEDLADSVRTGTPPRCTGDDGVAAIAVAEAVARSAASGDWAEVE